MNKDRLFKYKIGLGVIGLFVAVMLIVVLAQSGAVRHDKKVHEQADKIATKLNDYTDGQGKVPASLARAGVQDVSEDISYIKLSGLRYKFCATYKNDSNNFRPAYQLFNWYYGDSDYSYETSEDVDYLYISPKYHKGENCQTVRIYNYDTDAYGNPMTDYDTQSL